MIMMDNALWFLLLTPSVLLLSLLPIYFTHHRSDQRKNNKGSSVSSTALWKLLKDGNRLVETTAELLLATPTNTITIFSTVVTANPDNIEHVVKTNFDNYLKGDCSTGPLADLLGRGIFNSNGPHWKLQRKIATLGFNSKTARAFVMENIQREVTDRLLPRLSRAAEASETLDLQDVLDRLAFDSVCKFAFNVDPASLGDEREDCGRFARAYEAAVGISLQRFQRLRILWKLCRALNVGSERRLKAEISKVDDFAMRVVRDLKRNSGNDLLSRFILEGEGEGEGGDGFLRDVMTNLVLAGRDTTSSTMAWFFWLVSTRPSVEEKILEEIRSVRARGGNSNGAFTLEELREMEYLHAALSETLRLYPIVPIQERTCLADDVLPDGTQVRRGWSVMHNVYAMGRMESIWGADCREFRPERWLENGVFKPKSPFQYPVFLAGPRMCLGKELAFIQIKAVAASVIERFQMEVVEKGEREHLLYIVLRMKGGLPVRIRGRMREGLPRMPESDKESKLIEGYENTIE